MESLNQVWGVQNLENSKSLMFSSICDCLPKILCWGHLPQSVKNILKHKYQHKTITNTQIHMVEDTHENKGIECV